MGNIEDIKDILRGALASLGGFGGRMVARLFLMIAAGHLYGAAPLGLLGQVAAISEILAAIAVLGLRRSLLDLMSEDEAHGRDPLKTLVAAFLVAGALAVLMAAALGLAWPIMFPGTAMPTLLYLVVPSIVFAEVAGTAIRFKRIIRWEVIARCVMEPWSFLAAVLAFYVTGSIENGLLLAYAVSTMSAAAGMLIGLKHAFTLRELIAARTTWSRLIAVPNRSFAAGITDVGTMMFRRLDILALSLVVGHSQTGIYYMAQQIVTVPHKIHQLFEPMLSPVIAKLHHGAERSIIAQKLASICRWVFTLQLALTVPLFVFGSDILSLFGTEFAAGAGILVILLVAELLDGSFALTETPLIFAKPAVPPTLVMGALFIELIAVYTLAATWGAPGAAIGFLIAMAALNAMRLVTLRNKLSMNVLSLGFAWPLVFAAAIGPALIAVKAYGFTSAGWQVGSAIVAAIAVNLVLVRLLALSPLDRQVIQQLRSG